MSHLSHFFRNRRIDKKLSLGQLAQLLDYSNLSRGSNKIKAFEAGGKVHPALLGRLAEALEVSPDEIRQRAAEDHTGWLAGTSRKATFHG